MKSDPIKFVNLTLNNEIERQWKPEELITKIMPQDRLCAFETIIPDQLPALMIKNEDNQGVTLHSCFYGFNLEDNLQGQN